MRHNAHSFSLQPFINENTGPAPHAASAKEGCRFLISLSVLYVSVSVYLLISPWDGAITALPWMLGNLVQIMACLRGLRLSLSLSQQAFGAWSWQSQMEILYDCCLIILLWLLFAPTPWNLIQLPSKLKWLTEYVFTLMFLHNIYCQKLATWCKLKAGMRNTCRPNEFKKRNTSPVKFNLTSSFLPSRGLLPCTPPIAEECVILFLWNICYNPWRLSGFILWNWILVYDEVLSTQV